MRRRPAVCPSCDTVHVSTMAVAVGRFRPSGPLGYRARPGGPLRPTRAEAVEDACRGLAARLAA